MTVFLRRNLGEKNGIVVIVTGTPSTGKTTIAKRLAKKINAMYVDVNKLVKKHVLSI